MPLAEYLPLDLAPESAPGASTIHSTYSFPLPQTVPRSLPDAQLLAALHVIHFRCTGIESAVTGYWDGIKLRGLALRVDGTARLSTIFNDATEALYENARIQDPLVNLRVALSTVKCIELLNEVHATWSVDRSAENLSLHVVYDSSYYPKEAVIDLAEDVVDILSSSPHVAVDEIHFTHVHQRLLRANISIQPPSITPYTHTNIADAFGEMAARHPKNIAVVEGPTSFTYSEFDILLNVLAAKISQALEGKKVADLIACCIPPSALAIVTIFAIVKHGAAYVPLDIRLPSSRLESVIDDSAPCMLITTADSPEVSLEGRDVVRLDVTDFLRDWQHIVSSYTAAPAPFCRVRQSNLAYVMFTSGTTGKPKGVCIKHSAVLALADGGHVQLSPGIRVAQINNLAWDGSVFDLWCTLLSGATLVSLDRYEILEPKSLAQLFRHFRVDCCLITPSLFRQILTIAPELFGELHIVATGGESVYFEQYHRLRSINRDLKIFNIYGPTETCCYVTSNTVLPTDDIPPRGVVPIGPPCDYAQCLVVDMHDRLVHPGVLGELIIGGESVGDGYLNRPKETSLAFVDLSFDGIAEPAKKFYRTGDLVKWLPNGKIMFAGRRGVGQVKIRGQRLELTEVEEGLVRTGLVSHAAVAYVKLGDREPYLTAYAVAAPDRAVRPQEVLKLLKTQFPGYMVPRQLTYIDNLPLTSTGKLDRRRISDMALEADSVPCHASLQSVDDYVVPTSGPEKRICELFKEVLPTSDPVGATSNFFDVGGHSLLAMRLKWRLEEEFHIPVTIQDIFQKQTPRALVELVEAQNTPTASVLLPTRPDELQPLSLGQQRMYHLTQKVLDPKDGVYNTSAWLRLSGTLDEGVLEKSIQEIVRRHEGLRSVFVEISDSPMAQVTNWSPTLSKVDIDPSWNQERLETRLRVDCKVAFPLAEQPPFRPVLYRVGGKRYILMISMHHIITDGFAHDILFSELVAIYPAFLRGEPHPLPPLRLQYSSYAQWQNTSAYEELVRPQLQHWDRILSGQKPVSFPPDFQIPFKPGMVGAVYSIPYSADLLKGLETLCKTERVTMYMLFMAVFRVLHYQLTGEPDGSIGGSIANRKLPGTLKICGYFNNILLYRTCIVEGESFLTFLGRVRDVTMEAYANQDAPLARVLAQLKSDSPPIRTMLAYHNFEMTSFDVGESGLKADNFDLDMRLNQYQIEMKFVRHGDRINGNFHYPVDLYKATTIDWLGRKLTELLKTVVETPTFKVRAVEDGWQPPRA
ncbi:hypothetical protein B0H10DRAFT_1911013 [Mycena sp. CBHHK59/15]|nr:hypothetical protein B0H10DRAFT_1911013 [Mycena sp. CBHHK59/15]